MTDATLVSSASGVSQPAHTHRTFALSRISSRLGPNTLVLASYAVLGLLADLPIYPGDPNRVPTLLGEDIVQTTWFLEYTAWALTHGKNLFSTSLLNYPAGVDLAQNTGIPLLGLVTAPLTLLVSPVASLNLLRFLAFTLSAYAAYWVIRHWTAWAPAAFVGGLLYGFSPYMVSQGELHLNLMFVPLPPLLLYGLYSLLVVQRKPAWKTGIWLGLGAAAQFYISAEVLATTALIGGLAAFFLFFLCIHEVRQRALHAAIGLVVGGAVVALLIAYPVFLMFHGPQHYAGAAQGLNNVYNADLLGPILPTHSQLVAPTHLQALGSALVGRNPQENGSYLGIPLIAITIFCVVRSWRKLWPLYLALLAVTSFILSLGPFLIIDGHLHVLPVDLPFRKLDRLPGIDNILPVRISLYVVLFVAIILALSLDGWRAKVVERERLATGTGAWYSYGRSQTALRVGGGIVVLASVVGLLPRWPYKTVPVRVNPAELAHGLRGIPNNAVVLAYPYPTSFNDQAMLWQALDDMRFRLLGGYALVRGTRGTATGFPRVLRPSQVEAMLINSVTPQPDPSFPDLVATDETVLATTVIALRRGEPLPVGPPPTVVGRIGSFLTSGTFYIEPNKYTPERVEVSRATHFIDHGSRHATFASVLSDERVAVYGRVTAGTVTPVMVSGLRQFLANNHVRSVVIGLGTTDAWVVGKWMIAAIGRPTRAGSGGEIWTDVPASLQATSTPTHTSRQALMSENR